MTPDIDDEHDRLANELQEALDEMAMLSAQFGTATPDRAIVLHMARDRVTRIRADLRAVARSRLRPN